MNPTKEDKDTGKVEDDSTKETSEHVTVPEEFQQKVGECIDMATSKHHLSHMRDRVYQKEDEMRQAEMKNKGKGKTPEVMSSADMPEEAD